MFGRRRARKDPPTAPGTPPSAAPPYQAPGYQVAAAYRPVPSYPPAPSYPPPAGYGPPPGYPPVYGHRAPMPAGGPRPTPPPHRGGARPQSSGPRRYATREEAIREELESVVYLNGGDPLDYDLEAVADRVLAGNDREGYYLPPETGWRSWISGLWDDIEDEEY